MTHDRTDCSLLQLDFSTAPLKEIDGTPQSKCRNEMRPNKSKEISKRVFPQTRLVNFIPYFYTASRSQTCSHRSR
jgi:hypothetical protein